MIYFLLKLSAGFLFAWSFGVLIGNYKRNKLWKKIEAGTEYQLGIMRGAKNRAMINKTDDQLREIVRERLMRDARDGPVTVTQKWWAYPFWN